MESVKGPMPVPAADSINTATERELIETAKSSVEGLSMVPRIIYSSLDLGNSSLTPLLPLLLLLPSLRLERERLTCW
jgi:hypothetical protein